jgi:hypothetical protein
MNGDSELKSPGAKARARAARDGGHSHVGAGTCESVSSLVRPGGAVVRIGSSC